MLTNERKKLLTLILNDPHSTEFERSEAQLELDRDVNPRSVIHSENDPPTQSESDYASELGVANIVGPDYAVDYLLSSRATTVHAHLWLREVESTLERISNLPQDIDEHSRESLLGVVDGYLQGLQRVSVSHDSEIVRGEADRLVRKFSNMGESNVAEA